MRFPGSNCERETVRALERVGSRPARIVRWNEPPEALLRFDAYVLPGGFSYQDRIRAGAVAARLPLLEVVSRRAREGAPVLGICNGAQILVEAGSCRRAPRRARRPGRTTRCAWRWRPTGSGGATATTRAGSSSRPGAAAERCLFTRGLEEPMPMPMAHGEGRFVTADPELSDGLAACGGAALRRSRRRAGRRLPGEPERLARRRRGPVGGDGNVLALMPHPERAQDLAPGAGMAGGDLGRAPRAARGARASRATGPACASSGWRGRWARGGSSTA